MIAIGGIPPNIAMTDFTPDIWPQGLGIFGLTEMIWKDSYNDSAALYSTPSQVRDYITANGSYPLEWTAIHLGS